MKRIAIFILIAVVLSCFCGCQTKPYEYSGEYADLYTEAICSILGADGIIGGPAGPGDPAMGVIEEDAYGRRMFIYEEPTIMTKYSVFLFISQKTENNVVYYYSDYNFIIFLTEEILQYYEDTKDAPDAVPWWESSRYAEKIASLKTANDWGQEISIEKCIKQTVARKKEDPLTEKEKNTLYKSIFEKNETNGYKYIEFASTDDEGKLLLLASNIDSSLMDYRMVIIDGDSHYNQKITDIMAYQEELAAFKREHNWKKS